MLRGTLASMSDISMLFTFPVSFRSSFYIRFSLMVRRRLSWAKLRGLICYINYLKLFRSLFPRHNSSHVPSCDPTANEEFPQRLEQTLICTRFSHPESSLHDAKNSGYLMISEPWYTFLQEKKSRFHPISSIESEVAIRQQVAKTVLP